VNVDIEFPYMPCDILGLDIEDTLGKHIGDYYGELHKYRLAADGTELNIESWSDKNSSRQKLYERVDKELAENQGCKLKG
jgi:hypothetical protein